jgi:hypothetical protein
MHFHKLFTGHNSNSVDEFRSIEWYYYRAVIAQSVYCWDMGWMIRILGFDSWQGHEADHSPPSSAEVKNA